MVYYLDRCKIKKISYSHQHLSPSLYIGDNQIPIRGKSRRYAASTAKAFATHHCHAGSIRAPCADNNA